MINILKPTLTRNDGIAAILTGVMLVLLFPPFNLTPLIAIALVPLFLRLRKDAFRTNAEMGFLSGFIFYVGLLQWLHHVTIGGMLALVFYLSSIHTLACALVGWSKRYPVWIPLTALVWAAMEYLRSLGPLSFAWGFLGHGLYPNLPMMQAVYWIGVPGLTFIFVGINATLAEGLGYLIRRKKVTLPTPASRFSFWFPCMSLIVFLGLVGYGYRYGQSVIQSLDERHPQSIPLRIGLIQGAFEQERKETASENETLDVYLDLSTQSLAERPDLIIWPESTITTPIEYWAEGIAQIQHFVDQNNVELLIGTVRGSYTENRRWRFWNQALLFSPGHVFDLDQDPIDLTSLPSYSKTHLVPFGEWIPLGQYWPLYYIETMIEEAGAGIFEPGQSLTLFQSRKGVRFAVTICFESTIPALWRQAKNEGADFIVNLTNDAWYKKSVGLQQHFSQCVFRAAENRLPVVRVANTGISGIISPTGKTISTLPPFQATYGVFEIAIPLSTRETN